MGSPEARQRERLLKWSLARKSVVCCRPVWQSRAGPRGVIRERPESGRDRTPQGLWASKGHRQEGQWEVPGGFFAEK